METDHTALRDPASDEQAVKEAAELLRKWAELPTPNRVYPPTPGTATFHAHVKRLGGLEGACTAIALAKLDVDGDGSFSEEERAFFEETANKLVESTLNFNINTGVVAALILSMVFPFAMSAPESDQQWESSVQVALLMLYLIFMQLSLACSLSLIYISSRMYVHIVYWMPNVYSQIWYVRQQRQMILFISLLQLCQIFFVAFAVIFGAVYVYALKGLLALFPVVACGSIWACWEIPTASACAKHQHILTKRMWQRTPPSEVSMT